jgi:putative ABC transport system ATP-binding protein
MEQKNRERPSGGYVNSMIVQIENLWKAYPSPGSETLPVLTGVNCALAVGATLAVTGQSGSGKSTLIALLAGLDRPDQGRLVVNGADLVAMNEAQMTRFRAENIGIVFQQFHLLPHLSAAENISLPLELLGRPCGHEKIDAILAQVGLSARRNHLPGQLSGGECQRVAIARALVVEPAILLADEPTGNLDVSTGREVSDLLFALVAKANMTMLVVTHNQELAARCTHQLRLEQGVLQ